MVKENLQKVEDNITAACERAGRKRENVTLIAVSKTKPIEMIVEAYEAGKRDFGENKAQEMKEKHDALADDIKWHFIGHLQTYKVKYVDSLHLAEAIEKESAKKNLISEILIEVNVAHEESKFGLKTEEVEQLVRDIAKFQHIRIKGLMTIAPYVENAEENRNIFKELKTLSVDISNKNIDNVNMDILSMGMTGDYEVAVEEGATLVRVGTGIFGERNYSI